jgi:hypothetical protein
VSQYSNGSFNGGSARFEKACGREPFFLFPFIYQSPVEFTYLTLSNLPKAVFKASKRNGDDASVPNNKSIYTSIDFL